MTIYVGSVYAFHAKYTLDGAPIAPETVTFAITKPDASVVTRAWPADPEVVRTAMNEFTFEVTLDQAGTWRWLATPTGDIVAPEGGGVVVDPLPVTSIIVVQDAATPAPNPVNGASVLVQSDEEIIAGGTTDATGSFSFTHAPGSTLIVSAEKDGFFPSLAKHTFPGGSPFTVTIETIDVVQLTPPRQVTVYGFVSGGDGQLLEGVRVAIETVGRSLDNFVVPDSAGQGIDPHELGVANQRYERRTNSSGFWWISLAVNTRVRVSIPSMRLDRFFTVPDEIGITRLNIRDARTDPGPGGELNVVSDTPTFDTLKGVS